MIAPRRFKTSVVDWSAGLCVPRSPFRFRQKLQKSRTEIYIWAQNVHCFCFAFCVEEKQQLAQEMCERKTAFSMCSECMCVCVHVHAHTNTFTTTRIKKIRKTQTTLLFPFLSKTTPHAKQQVLCIDWTIPSSCPNTNEQTAHTRTHWASRTRPAEGVLADM